MKTSRKIICIILIMIISSSFLIKLPVRVLAVDTTVNQIISDPYGECTYVLRSDGSLWAWGNNGYGQLGDGTKTEKLSPIKIMDGVESITPDGSRVFVIKNDGTLWGWGGGIELTPKKLANNVTSVSRIYNGYAIIKNDKSLWILYFNTQQEGGFQEIKFMDGVVSVAYVDNTVFALKEDKSLLGWGDQRLLGTGKYDIITDPIKIQDDVEVVATGGEYSSQYILTIKSDGGLWTWGGSTGLIYPTQIADGVLSVKTAALHGDVFNYAIKKDGSLWSWGDNSYGQLGDGTTERKENPVRVTDDAKSIVVGSYNIFIIKKDSSLWGWGTNSDGELGDGTRVQKLAPIKIADGVASVYSSINHTMMIKNDRSLWTYGNNYNYELGDGTNKDKLSPVKIMDDVVTGGIGKYWTYALKSDGSFWSWGYDYWDGYLGDGKSSEFSPSPGMRIPTYSTVSSSSAESFVFDNIPNHSKGQPFDVVIKAIDQSNNTAAGFNEEVHLSASNNAKIEPTKIKFQNGEWRGKVNVYESGASINLSLSYGSRYGQSNIFTVGPQGFSKIAGQVIDGDEIGISGAKVILDSETDQKLEIYTDDFGFYKFDNILAGKHTILAKSSGKSSLPKEMEVRADMVNTRDIVIPSGLKPAVYIPGIMGSTIIGTSNFIYPSLPAKINKGNNFSEDSNLEILNPLNKMKLKDLREALRQEGYELYLAPYDWRVPLEDLGKEFGNYAEDIKNKTGQKVTVIAHSMGGLITREYIQSDYYNDTVDNFIMVGTPNGGSSNTYYIWQGGDTLTIDRKVMTLIPPLFYTNTTNKLFKTRTGFSPFKGELSSFNDYIYALIPNKIMQKFIQSEAPTIGYLNPEYKFLYTDTGMQNIKNENDVNKFLINLNENNPNKQRLTKESGINKVRTLLLLGNSERTLNFITVGDKGNDGMYADGEPINTLFMTNGDGTVVANKAAVPFVVNNQEQIFINKGSYGSHGMLIGNKGIQDKIADFLSFNNVNSSSLRSTKADIRVSSVVDQPSKSLWISIDGSVQPYLTNSSGEGMGINPASNTLEQNIAGAKVTLLNSTSSLNLNNVEDGEYTLKLKGSLEDVYLLSVGYYDSSKQISLDRSGVYHNDILTLNILVDSNAAEPVKVIDKAEQPRNVIVEEKDGLTNLKWDVQNPADVKAYNIYCKKDNEAFYRLLASTTSQSYVTDKPWIMNGQGENYQFIVTAINTKNDESFYYGAVSNFISIVAGFSFEKQSTTYPLTVQFKDNSAGNPTSWKWDFNNDGIIDSTEQNPTYTYTEPGNYTVSLTVSGANGEDYITKPNCVNVESPLKILSVIPAEGASYISVNQTFTVTFSNTIAKGTNYSNISLKDDNLNLISISTIIEENKIIIKPSALLKANSVYSVVLPENAVMGKDSSINQAYSCLFQTSEKSQDLNNDGTIDIKDLAEAAKKYNIKSTYALWDRNYDLNDDYSIDIYDLVILSKYI